MRPLHVVGRSRDGQQLLLATAAGGRAAYALPIDGRLERVLKGLDPDHVSDATDAETVSPRQIQALLRSGCDVAEVAAQLRVPVSRVDRYAGPVLSERSRMLGTIQSAAVERPRLGLSPTALGDAVAAHLDGLAHVRPGSVSWTAMRADSGEWLARLDVVIRGRPRRAEWRLGAAGRLTPLSAWAAELGFPTPTPGVRRRRAPRAEAAAGPP